MKHRFGSVTVEAIETYVRVTVSNFGGPGAPDRIAVTKHECPSAVEVAQLVSDMRGYWPDDAVLQGCSRAAAEAKANVTELVL